MQNIIDTLKAEITKVKIEIEAIIERDKEAILADYKGISAYVGTDLTALKRKLEHLKDILRNVEMFIQKYV